MLYTGGNLNIKNFNEWPPIDDYEGMHGLRKIFVNSNKLHSSLEPKLKCSKSKNKFEKKKCKLILPPAPPDSRSHNFFTNNNPSEI